MKTLKKYFRVPETYVGIIMALVIQLVFFLVWLSVFNGADNRLNQLRVAMVSDDQQSQIIVENLKENLPFQMGRIDSIESAKRELDLRKWDMVVYFPSTFSEELSKGNSSSIEYFINQASSSVSKQAMESVSVKITDQVNKQVFNSQKKVTSTITKTNSSDSFASNYLPLMLIIISYVGAMVMNLLLNMAKDKVSANKWEITATKLGIDIFASLLISLVTLSMLYAFNIPTKVDFIHMWILQSTAFFTFLVFSGIFFNLFGKLGMVFNLIFLVTQLATSGVLMPRVMLSNLFNTISSYLPATYAVDGYFSILYGGGDISQSSMNLVTFSVISIALILVHTFIRRGTIQKDLVSTATQ